MPREIRKRGKKKSKAQAEESSELAYKKHAEPVPEPEPTSSTTPTWMKESATSLSANGALADIEAPFGYVDADVKAYFRTVDSQLREWQEANESGGGGAAEDGPQDEDPFECSSPLQNYSQDEC